MEMPHPTPLDSPPGHKLQKPSKNLTLFSHLGTISSVLVDLKAESKG